MSVLPVRACANSYSDSSLKDIGGLIGYNLYGTVRNNSYTTGSVSASAVCDDRMAMCYRIGGLVGDNQKVVENCYAAAAFSASASGPHTITQNQGGFCGGNWGTVTNCFWDTVVSGMTESAAGTGKTTAEMINESMFAGAGWDFTTDWYMPGSSYPKLIWESATPVNLEAFSMLAQYWQMTGCVQGQACSDADWYVDGTIDILDLNQLALSWLKIK